MRTGFPEPTSDEPDGDQLTDWLTESYAQATDGCHVEPDGFCPHGHPSWLIHLDYL